MTIVFFNAVDNSERISLTDFELQNDSKVKA